MATTQNTITPDASETTHSSERPSTPQAIRTVIHDEGLPEVVNSNQATTTQYYDAPIPVDSETDKRFNEAPIPIDTLDKDESSPALPPRHSTGTPQHQYPYPNSPDSYGLPLQQQMRRQYQQHRQSGHSTYSPQLPPYNSNEVVTYVTPLDKLGDQPKFVDCPFCKHRVETRVKKISSKMTHVSATALGFATIVGAAVPYAGKWCSHIAHYCTNCDHQVAIRKWGSREMKPQGTPEHMREVSRYAPAHPSGMTIVNNRINYHGTRSHRRREAHLPRHEPPGWPPGPKLTLAGNLPYEAKPFEVEEVLAQNGFDSLDKIHISIDPVSARNPGYCFVDFHDRVTAERALSSLNATIYGRTLKVGPCEPKKLRERRGFRDEGRRWGDWSTKSGDAGNTNGHTDGRGEQKGPNWALDHFEDVVRDHSGRRLYVGGLDKMIDQAQHQDELAQIFSGFKPTAIGKRITPHESKKTQPGNHHYCFVDFETKEEAISAVGALNGKEVPGGQLKVSVSERIPQKLVGRQLDSQTARRYERPNNTRPNKPETNNAMASNNWRRKD
ncbi:rna recognition protein [Fusarium austroafricanum]|uniref:Rna recognition protein n=1 Tax=Fusarium austroafricanum TaxID=2364996 RepID=A0A8H4P6K0_9HYPO|nr:rna recognition protein [Fusarium austroafricanum]